MSWTWSTRIWSTRYRRYELALVGASVVGIVGLLTGRCVLQHVGALVTVADIALAFVAVPERARMARARSAALNAREIQLATDEVGRDVIARGEDFDAETIRTVLERVLTRDVADVAEQHEAGLALAEAFVLGLGTFVWDFGDLWPYHPIRLFGP